MFQFKVNNTDRWVATQKKPRRLTFTGTIFHKESNNYFNIRYTVSGLKVNIKVKRIHLKSATFRLK